LKQPAAPGIESDREVFVEQREHHEQENADPEAPRDQGLLDRQKRLGVRSLHFYL
jgi:hypothetical protein